MKVIVDRTKWCRGAINNSSTGGSSLLTDTGYMCCLGFACKQLFNVEDIRLLRVGFPGRVYLSMPPFTFTDSESIHNSSQFSYSAGKINDSKEIGDNEREARLISLFKVNGIELEFTN